MKTSARSGLELAPAKPPGEDKVRGYLSLARRENTQRSYANALKHFEESWGGVLPASGEMIARYLANFADELSSNTLEQRLAALSRWHSDHGFANPTRASIVRNVLKGIRASHPREERRAKPLMLGQIQAVDDWIHAQLQTLDAARDAPRHLQLKRDRALLLLGFWRGFRGDELVKLQVDHLHIDSDKGMECFLPQSKTDTQFRGRTFTVPALSRLCPVTATSEWLEACQATSGSVFRAINRWGQISERGLRPASLIHIFRNLFRQAGVALPEQYSAHSLRRGFATWAADQGWDVASLMQYVGWKDMKAALRYVEASPRMAKQRIEWSLAQLPAPETNVELKHNMLPAPEDGTDALPDLVTLRLKMVLTPYVGRSRGTAQARKRIESLCLSRSGMKRRDAQGTQYDVTFPAEALDDTVQEAIDEMHRIAESCRCQLEASFHDRGSDIYWS